MSEQFSPRMRYASPSGGERHVTLNACPFASPESQSDTTTVCVCDAAVGGSRALMASPSLNVYDGRARRVGASSMSTRVMERRAVAVSWPRSVSFAALLSVTPSKSTQLRTPSSQSKGEATWRTQEEGLASFHAFPAFPPTMA